jgi:transposase InsO family protein
MWNDTHKFVCSYHTCIANKPSNRQPLGEARPLPVPTRPWVQVGLDISGPHVTSRRGNTWLLVFVDHLSKQIHLAAAPGHAGNPLSAEVCANLFFSTVVKHHGLPDILVSDRGSQWLSEFWRTLFKHCGTNLRFSTAYHPETDGLSERTIRTVIDTLRCCLDGTHEAWDEHLDAIELALNSSVSASTGLAPFEIVYGNNDRMELLDLCVSTDQSWLL